MAASMPEAAPNRPSTPLLVASTLAWLAGALGLATVVAVGIPQVSRFGQLPLLLVLDAVLALGLCVAGYLLRKRRRAGGILAAVIFALSGASHLAAGALLSVGFGITLVAVVLVLMRWPELQTGAAV